MQTIKQLSDYLPLGSTGIFSSFDNPVWAVDFPDTDELDTYFILNYGERFGSKIIENFADETDGTVKGENLKTLSKIIYDINSRKWSHLYDVYKAEYNPIENTDFVETINDNDTFDSNSAGNSTSNGAASTTSNGSVAGSNSSDNDVYGFNSVSAVGESTISGNNSETTNSTSNTTNNNSMNDTSEKHDINTHQSIHKKHGNIGVTSTTELMQGTVDFWKWSFIDIVSMSCRNNASR